MAKIKLEIVGLSSSQSQAGSFALILGEEGRSRRLPIIIGMFEAQAIALEMEKIVSSRPVTHDLFKSFAQNFHFSLQEVIISDIRDGIFYAEIVCKDSRDGRVVTIDARPSDAIAIGIRFKVPIYTYESIIEEAGIVLNTSEEEIAASDDEKDDGKQSGQEARHIARPDSPSQTQNVHGRPSKLQDYTDEQLESMLNEAIENENYERAALLRDELNKRGKD